MAEPARMLSGDDLAKFAALAGAVSAWVALAMTRPDLAKALADRAIEHEKAKRLAEVRGDG